MNETKLTESEDSDVMEFDYCDISDLKTTIPDGVKDLQLCCSDGIYRLSYSFYDNKFIKYFFTKSSNESLACDMAESDAEIEELGLDPSNCIDAVYRCDTSTSGIPDDTYENVGKTMRAHYPNGKAEEYSKHYYDTLKEDKPGHGLFPTELFDTWSDRVLNKLPRTFNYIYENTGMGIIIIPVKVIYANHCRELDDVFKESMKEVINSVPKEKRYSFKALPGLVRIFAYPASMIVSEYFYCVSPKEKEIIPNLNDDKIKPIPVKAFNIETIKGIISSCRDFLKRIL